MWTTNDPIIAEVTLPLVWCCGEKGVGDCFADRFRDLDGRGARLVIERHDLLAKTPS
jgi:hypothetical protein